MIEPGTMFGKLEIVALISKPEDEDERYRVRCHSCRSDCVLASADALMQGRARQCFDCAALARMTPHQRTVIGIQAQDGLSKLHTGVRPCGHCS